MDTKREEQKNDKENEKLFSLGMYVLDNGEVATITLTPIKEFGEVGQYTWEEIQTMRLLIKENPHPIWSEDQWTSKQQLNDYSAHIKDLIKR